MLFSRLRIVAPLLLLPQALLPTLVAAAAAISLAGASRLRVHLI